MGELGDCCPHNHICEKLIGDVSSIYCLIPHALDCAGCTSLLSGVFNEKHGNRVENTLLVINVLAGVDVVASDGDIPGALFFNARFPK